jgi:hypothetical protein
MFTPKSLILFCVYSLSQGQTSYHTSDVGGSYTRVSHGSNTHGDSGYAASAPVTTYHQPAPSPSYHQPATTYHQPATTYKQPAATYQQPAATYHQPAATYQQPAATYHQPAASYHQPTTTYKQPAATYHQPAATYHQPAATYHQPAATYHEPAANYHQPAAVHHAAPVKNSYGDKCHLDYKDEDVEICVPTLESNCSSEKTGNGITITEEYDCKPITRTICTEYEHYEQVEVCAVSYTLQEVPSKAKLVHVDWVKECKDEVICQSPHAKGAYHPDVYCKEQIKSVCYDSPVLNPVYRDVVLKLPQPYDVCITKEIALPRVKCTQVVENKCSYSQRVRDPEDIYLDKCTVAFGLEQCSHSQIRLPKQGCLKTFKEIKNVYEEE